MASYIADLVKIEALSIALIAGAGVTLVMGASASEAVSFGAMAALGTSVGNTTLTAVGQMAKIDTYDSSANYFDASDFLAGGLATGILQYGVTGVSGTPLYQTMAIAAIAAGFAPRVTKAIHDSLTAAASPATTSAMQNN